MNITDIVLIAGFVANLLTIVAGIVKMVSVFTSTSNKITALEITQQHMQKDMIELKKLLIEKRWPNAKVKIK